jgi:hypothetical protein
MTIPDPDDFQILQPGDLYRFFKYLNPIIILVKSKRGRSFLLDDISIMHRLTHLVASGIKDRELMVLQSEDIVFCLETRFEVEKSTFLVGWPCWEGVKIDTVLCQGGL